MPTWGGGAVCPACGKSVSVIEEVKGPGGKPWHAACLRCKECKKSSRDGQWRESDGDPYCASCYLLKFRPDSSRPGGRSETVRMSLKERMQLYQGAAAGSKSGEVSPSVSAPKLPSVAEVDTQAEKERKAQAAQAAEEARVAAELEAARVAAELEAARLAAEAKVKAEEEAAEKERQARAEAEAKTAKAEAAKIADAAKLKAAAVASHERAAAQEGGEVAPEATGVPCDNFRLDLAGKSFGDCQCGFPKSAHGVVKTNAAAPRDQRDYQRSFSCRVIGDQRADQPCDNYKLDVAGKLFGDCQCGFPKSAHGVVKFASAPDQKEETEEASLTEAKQLAREPCSNYQLDVAGSSFGDCKCGHPKRAHR